MAEKAEIEPEDAERPFLSHLLELRSRLMRSAIAVIAIFLCLYPFSERLYGWFAGPLVKVLPAGSHMIATKVADTFLVPMKLSLILAIFLCMPYLLYQLWAFVAPGLYKHERRLVWPLMAASVALFYIGAAFAYFVVFPLIFKFFTSIAPEGVLPMTDMGEYLSFVLTLFFAFGAAFQVPIAHDSAGEDRGGDPPGHGPEAAVRGGCRLLHRHGADAAGRRLPSPAGRAHLDALRDRVVAVPVLRRACDGGNRRGRGRLIRHAGPNAPCDAARCQRRGLLAPGAEALCSSGGACTSL